MLYCHVNISNLSFIIVQKCSCFFWSTEKEKWSQNVGGSKAILDRTREANYSIIFFQDTSQTRMTMLSFSSSFWPGALCQHNLITSLLAVRIPCSLMCTTLCAFDSAPFCANGYWAVLVNASLISARSRLCGRVLQETLKRRNAIGTQAVLSAWGSSELRL